MSGSEGAKGGLDSEGLDWRAPVLAGSTWAGVWTGTAGVPMLVGGMAALALLIGLLGWWRRRWLVVTFGIVLLLAMTVGGARGWVKSTGPVGEWADQGAVVSIEARLGGGHLSSGGRGGPLWVVDAELVRAEGRGISWMTGVTVRLTASGDLVGRWSAVPAGATVAAVVRLSPAESQEPVSAWARARVDPIVLEPPGPVDAAVTHVRAGLRNAVAGLPPEPAALVPALVVGDTQGMSEALRARFQTTGLTHLTAVSGGNRMGYGGGVEDAPALCAQS